MRLSLVFFIVIQVFLFPIIPLSLPQCVCVFTVYFYSLHLPICHSKLWFRFCSIDSFLLLQMIQAHTHTRTRVWHMLCLATFHVKLSDLFCSSSSSSSSSFFLSGCVCMCVRVNVYNIRNICFLFDARIAKCSNSCIRAVLLILIRLINIWTLHLYNNMNWMERWTFRNI